MLKTKEKRYLSLHETCAWTADYIKALIMTYRVRIMIKADVNIKNWLIDLFRTPVHVNVNVVNYVILLDT